MKSFTKNNINSMPIPLEAGYTAEFDNVDKNEWHDIIGLFDDGNFYQTWDYEDPSSKYLKLSHFVLKKDDYVIAAAQVCIVSIPVFKAGIAYVRWGPLWKRKGQTQDLEILVHALRALRAEYVDGRHLLLRIFPLLFDDQRKTFLPIFKVEKFKRNRFEEMQRTLLVDLRPSIDELKRGCRRTWRQKIGYAVKNKLEIIEGTSTELIEDAIKVYDEMHQRKMFFGVQGMEKYLDIQKELPDDLKLKTMICKDKGNFVAAMVWAAIGEMGLPVLAATGTKGLTNYSSYLLWWKMLESLKCQGKYFLNVGGISPERNFGGYVFKKGFAGKNGSDVYLLGKFEAYKFDHLASALSYAVVKVNDLVRFINARLGYFAWKVAHPNKKKKKMNQVSDKKA